MYRNSLGRRLSTNMWAPRRWASLCLPTSGRLGGLCKNIFSNETEAGEAKKCSLIWLLVYFYPYLQNDSTL